MKKTYPDTDTRVRYFIGDVRDHNRLSRAATNADIIIHAAAMKQIVACEYQPMEAVLTNIIGAGNVIDAGIDKGVGEEMLKLGIEWLKARGYCRHAYRRSG